MSSWQISHSHITDLLDPQSSIFCTMSYPSSTFHAPSPTGDKGLCGSYLSEHNMLAVEVCSARRRYEELEEKRHLSLSAHDALVPPVLRCSQPRHWPWTPGPRACA
eukprot:766842-Hanusia_phi.AAC.11